MQELFSLGEMYVSDFLSPDENPRCNKVEMKLLLTNDGSVRLEKIANKDFMYGKYWYRSGINSSMSIDLKEIVTNIKKLIKIEKDDVWLDIACNDGTLLKHVDDTCFRLGIDPADDSYKSESSLHADEIIQNYFSYEAYSSSKFSSKKPKVITTIAMFYDLDDPDSFIQDVHKVIDDDGLWVLQMSYTPLMIQQLAFDNICHEHVYYYSLFNIKELFKRNGFEILDCELNTVNGGSFRIYAMKDTANFKKFGTQPHRDVAYFRMQSILEYENKLQIDSKETWIKFYEEIENLKEKTVSFIKSEKANGKKIWAYGASTKGNTLLQYFGLDNTLIDGIAERSHYKFGKRTIGTNIPIYSEAQMREENPDYLLVLPWHFISEFLERESEYLKNGGKFIVPCPKFEIIGK
jgi:hypothetical protein